MSNTKLNIVTIHCRGVHFYYFFLLICIVLLFFSSSTFAQSTAIKGCLTDTSNNALIGAIITLNPGNYNTKTDESGYFAFYKIPNGKYYIKVFILDMKTILTVFSLQMRYKALR